MLSSTWFDFLKCGWFWIQARVFQLYLDNSTGYNKIVSAILFSSKCESADTNCLVFWAHWEIGKILMKRQVYNNEFFTNFGYFSELKTLIPLEREVDCEWNDINSFSVPCFFVELFIRKNHNSAFDKCKCAYMYVVALDAFQVDFMLEHVCACSIKLSAWTHDWHQCHIL